MLQKFQNIIFICIIKIAVITLKSFDAKPFRSLLNHYIALSAVFPLLSTFILLKL